MGYSISMFTFPYMNICNFPSTYFSKQCLYLICYYFILLWNIANKLEMNSFVLQRSNNHFNNLKKPL